MLIHGRGFFGGDDLTATISPAGSLGAAQDAGDIALPLTALSLGSAQATLPATLAPGVYDLFVQTPVGTAELLGVLNVEPATRILDLAPGFNLVAWTGDDDTPIADALAGVDGEVLGVSAWDVAAERFRTFSPTAPDFVNSLDQLSLGEGFWIQIGAGGATWTQPGFTAARTLDLVASLQLATWTGPDGTPLADALGEIGASVLRVLVWDVAAGAFRSFTAALPPALNDLTTLDFGDAFWISPDAAVRWQQPPG